MRKIYAIVGCRNLVMRHGRTEILSVVCNTRKTAEELLLRAKSEFPDYMIWLSWQWRDANGMKEFQRLPKHSRCGQW